MSYCLRCALAAVCQGTAELGRPCVATEPAQSLTELLRIWRCTVTLLAGFSYSAEPCISQHSDVLSACGCA